ncbi:DNA-binding transcriptional regulator, XRE-family HTH domain [Actinacidiphila alni]|uniref:DNA-binding transcriptional regulator, XRE-family HTH domain n=1 Tax=Actinacidiphila alni TaxID=380248 RepID=A0A1I2G2V2_9ACTN|nr:helix-turn-helix transcriptional regulator [Actinacidiphila alni]SFF11086.1 DNA-binding transcriptional regulator, XRE-family HTH domain [Actinacidiphila alni]
MPTKPPPRFPAERRALGDRIRRHREWAGRTQDDIVRAGLDRRTLQRIENGETDARLSWLLLIAHTIDITIGELLDTDPPTASTGAASSRGA